jgi:hypothetical protein
VQVLSGALIILFILGALGACHIKQQASLKTDGSGSVRFRFELEPFFLGALLEMASLDPNNRAVERKTIFDVEKIRQEFEKKPDIELVHIASPSPTLLEGEFTFRDVEAVFKGEQELTQAGVVSFDRGAEGNALRFHLDRGNFGQVASFLPMQNNPIFRILGPEENEGMTEEEYLEMMAFMLGAKGPPAIKASFVELEVDVEGEVIEQTGGRIEGKTVMFRIPLLDILLLDEPLDYSIIFR